MVLRLTTKDVVAAGGALLGLVGNTEEGNGLCRVSTEIR